MRRDSGNCDRGCVTPKCGRVDVNWQNEVTGDGHRRASLPDDRASRDGHGCGVERAHKTRGIEGATTMRNVPLATRFDEPPVERLADGSGR